MQDKNMNVTFHSLMVVGPKNSVYVPKSSFQEVCMKLSRKVVKRALLYSEVFMFYKITGNLMKSIRTVCRVQKIGKFVIRRLQILFGYILLVQK